MNLFEMAKNILFGIANYINIFIYSIEIQILG